MTQTKTRFIRTFQAAAFALAGTTIALPALAQAQNDQATSEQRVAPVDIRQSTVKIFTTSRGPDLTRPWTRQQPSNSTGSGLVIEGGRILTNAHVVEYGQQIFVQPYLTSQRLAAKVVARNTGIDLAVLELEDDSALDGVPIAALDADLPDIGDKANAYGYPLGGEELSITEGIVSRIEFVGYTAGTLGLRIQVDAALNPGNSGGPVAVDNRVIGLTFSGIQTADNIGYIIPNEEIRLFLDDIKDGDIDGRPFLRETFDNTRNPGIRAKLGLTSELEGMVVAGEIEGNPLKSWDVVTTIAGRSIDSQGLVSLTGDLRLYFEYFVHHGLNDDGTITLGVLRDGEQIEVRSPIVRGDDDFFPELDNDYPSYMVFGPLVFTPVYQAHVYGLDLNRMAARQSPIVSRAFRGEDEEAKVQQYVMLAGGLLNHRINLAYEVPPFSTLKSVNGTTITSFEHAITTIRDAAQSDEEFIIFEFYDRGADRLVYKRSDILNSMEDVLNENGIRRPISSDFADLWPDLGE
ncbi:MAG: trypsin-like peptidase domain-containing protein [Phycisphaerales bacterium JB064]